MRLFFGFIITILAAVSAQANMMTDFSGFYETDSFVTDTTSAYSKNFYSLDVLFEVDKGVRLYAGFHAHQLALREKPATTTTSLNSTDMGAQLLYYFTKKKNFFASTGYNISVNGQYSDGTTSSNLMGSSYEVCLGYVIEYSENISLGLKWNYINVKYNKSISDGVSSDVSYTRTLTFPAFTLVWHN